MSLSYVQYAYDFVVSAFITFIISVVPNTQIERLRKEKYKCVRNENHVVVHKQLMIVCTMDFEKEI